MSAAAEKTFNKLVGIETKVGRPSKASQEKKAIGRYSLDVLQNAIRRTNASQALKKQKAALQVQTAFRGFSAKKKVKQLEDTRIQRIERLRTPKPEKSANPAKITKKILNLDENIQLQKKIDYAKKKIAEKKEEIKISKDKIKEFKKQGYTEDDSPIYNVREKIMHLEDSIGFQKDKIKKKDFSLNSVDFYNKYYPWTIGGEYVKY